MVRKRLAEGKSVKIDTPTKAKAQREYNDVMLAKIFGRTEREIANTSVEFRDVCLSVLSIQSAVSDANFRKSTKK